MNILKFAPKSKRIPPLNVYPKIDLFVKLVPDDYQKISHHISKDNLTRQQHLALKQLQKMKKVLIKPVDKGGNVVVWARAMYEREAFRQLQDPCCFKQLSYNPTISFHLHYWNQLCLKE